MGALATAQINARIEPELKASGDAALAAAGLSPTQAIRALWELAARNADDPSTIETTLFPERTHQQMEAAQARRAGRMAAARRGAGLAGATMAAHGIPLPADGLPELSPDALRDLAYQEQFGTEGENLP